MTRATPKRDRQVTVLAYLAQSLPSDAVVWATPNGQKRSRYERTEFKALGGVAGAPDLFIALSGNVYGIELKAPKKKPSLAQLTLFVRLGIAGIPVGICHSVEDVEKYLCRWEVPLKAKVAA